MADDLRALDARLARALGWEEKRFINDTAHWIRSEGHVIRDYLMHPPLFSSAWEYAGELAEALNQRGWFIVAVQDGKAWGVDLDGPEGAHVSADEKTFPLALARAALVALEEHDGS